MSEQYDAVVVGSGPNGLSGAIHLARAGLSVLVIEGSDEIGGGTRTKELTLPGYRHDVCSAIMPFARDTKAFRDLPLEKFGLEWVYPPTETAHPLDGGRAAFMYQDIEQTAAQFPTDTRVYTRTVGNLVKNSEQLFDQILGPILRVPRHPITLARFGLPGLMAATRYVDRFDDEESRALFAGMASHAITALDLPGTAAVGLTFLVASHAFRWPLVKGGSANLTKAMAAYFESLGGTIVTGQMVESLSDLPPAQTALLSVTPPAFAKMFEGKLPSGYAEKAARWNFGPGVFKVDWALDGPIPWANPEVANAGTVHVGGTFEEIARAEHTVWNGGHADSPFVLVAQQSLFDHSRAPAGGHVAWGYTHVPNGSMLDGTKAIESQIERFAPGFRDRILSRSVMNSQQFEAYNPNYVGGDIAAGASTLAQTLGRPALTPSPHTTPIPGVFLCGASTSPGGGVHGMGGWHAAQAALKHLKHPT